MGIKDILIIVLIIAIIGVVLFGSLGNFLGMMAGVMNGVSDTVTNSEGYVYRGGYIDDYSVSDSSSQGSVVNGSDSASSSGGDLSSSGVAYEDYQRDYETGMVDQEGNPIYLSIISSSGGQMDPGIYQIYWSSLGPINQTRIG